MAAPKIDIVTVVFSGDLPLLDLQARSLARFLPAGLVGSIRFIINDPLEDECRAHVDQVTAPLLGPLRDRLIIERGSAYGSPGQEGWIIQQACKLDVARHIEAEHYLVLDAKYFLIRSIAEHDIFFKGDRARMPFSKRRGDPQWLIDSLIVFGLDPELANDKFPPSVPPFCMRTAVVRAMIGEIEARSGKSLFDFFATKTDASTEFMLYIAYLMAKGQLDEVLSRRGTKQPIIRRGSPARNDPETTFFQEAAERNAWTMAIHRRRFLDLDWDNPTRENILDVWTNSGLFADRDAATAEMNRLIAFYKGQRGTAMMANRAKTKGHAAPAQDVPVGEAQPPN